MGKLVNYCSVMGLLACCLLPHVASGGGCDGGKEVDRNGRGLANVKLKMVALVSILSAGCLGVLIPVLGRRVEALRPENDAFLVVKALAAGVIFSTALIHILPSAFRSLTSPCLPPESPLRDFPFAGFVSMLSALATMMVDTLATAYCRRSHLSKPQPADEEEDEVGPKQLSQGAGDRAPIANTPAGDGIRHRVVSQVLELGIVVHSVIIGISLGASGSGRTIRPLVGALSFHQFFEGIGLGGCILQARFRAKAMLIMAAFFSLTTPVGILIGIGVSSICDQDSPRSLATQGVLNAASAGILIYMALVDLLATDFRSAKMQTSCKLQLCSYTSLFLGAGFMSLLAKWA